MRETTNVFIVESPAKAKTIAKYLGDDFQVVASCGHVRDLPKDRLGVSLEDFAAEYEVTKPAVVDRIQKLVNKASAVWLATDGDREGEGIAAHLLACLRVPAGVPVHRTVFHEITPAAVQAAVAQPRALAASLVDAQNSRRLLDRLVGYQVSPFLWKALGHRDLSAGRVQSAALRLLVDHQRRIRDFVAQTETTATAAFMGPPEVGGLRASFMAPPGDATDLDEAWMRSLEGRTWRVLDATAAEALQYPSPPFITSTLQQEASRRLRLTAKQCMRAAQTLYEAGHITYLRTDSPALATPAQNAALAWVRSRIGDMYAHPRQYQAKGSHAQEAHEAIRPTRFDVEEMPASLSGAERQLYRLIWRRTVASQMAPAKDMVCTVRIAADGVDGEFLAHVRKTVFDGFRRVWTTDEPDAAADASVPDRYDRWVQHLVPGTPLAWNSVEVVQQPPFPPRHLTEASFIRALEEAGIGRPSTYEPTIHTLEARGYLERKTAHVCEVPVLTLRWAPGMVAVDPTRETRSRKESYALLPSERGQAVCDYLFMTFRELTDPSYTAEMETALDAVAGGKRSGTDLLRTYQTQLRDRLTAAAAAPPAVPSTTRSLPPRKDRGAATPEVRVLGDHPMLVQWEVRLFDRGRFGPFVMACPPPRSHQKALFASVPEGTTALESVTLAQALEWLQKASQRKKGTPGRKPRQETMKTKKISAGA